MKARILVSGAQGFIGRAVLGLLEAQGYQAVPLDIGDGDIATQPLRVKDIQHVLHLAARTYVPDSWREPYDFYRVNVLGTANMLEFARAQNCGITLVSSYLYGPPQELPVAESHPLDPSTPYNHSKYLAESIGLFYARHFGLRVTVLRPFNIYGPGQRGDFLIPTIIRQALDPQVEVIEVADLEPRRDYVYIEDLCRALLLSIGHTGGGIYNIGSGNSWSVAQAIQAVQSAVGSAKPIRSRGERRAGEVMDTRADIHLAHEELGWGPQVAFEEGIRRTVQAARAEGGIS